MARLLHTVTHGRSNSRWKRWRRPHKRVQSLPLAGSTIKDPEATTGRTTVPSISSMTFRFLRNSSKPPSIHDRWRLGGFRHRDHDLWIADQPRSSPEARAATVCRMPPTVPTGPAKFRIRIRSVSGFKHIGFSRTRQSARGGKTLVSTRCARPWARQLESVALQELQL